MPDKKTTIAYVDQTTEQRARVVSLQNFWDDHPVVKNFHGKWLEYIKFWEGDQYCFYNQHTGRIQDLKPFINRDVKNVYNRITPIIRQLWGQLRYKHEFYGEPQTTEGPDIQAARITSMIIEFTNYASKWGFTGKINLAKLWALICGVVYWKEFYNSELPYFTEGDKGKVIERKGDIDFAMVNPFNVRPDPQSRTGRRGWHKFMEGQRVTVASVAEEFGIDEKDLPGEESETAAVSNTGLLERGEYEREKVKTCVRKEYYETPSKANPEGRFYVIAGQFIGYEGDNPNPGGQIGYFDLRGMIPILDEQYGESMVKILQPSQRQFNRLCSMVDEHIQEFRIKGLIARGSLSSADSAAFRRSGIDYLEYNPRAGNPPYLQTPPGIPDTHMNWITHQQNEMKEQSSVRDVSMGQLPKYASRASGVLWEGLKEQDTIVLVPMVEEWDQKLQEIMSYRLQLIQKYWKAPRLVKVLGKKGTETSVKFFSKADIRDSTDVRVRPGIEIFTNKEAKQQAVNMMVEKGMIQDPKDALELLGLESGLEDYIEMKYVDKRQATRYLEQLKSGKKDIPEVEPDDDNEIQYQVFNDFRKTQEFEELKDNIQAAIRERLDQIKLFRGLTGANVEGEMGGETAADEGMEAEAAAPVAVPPEMAGLTGGV